MRTDLARPAAASLLAAGLLAAAAVAQNPTVPGALAGVEGGGGTNIPFGSNQACRYQCIYDAEELPWVGPRVITGILLRADNNTPNTAIPAKGFLEISVLMSTTSKTSVTASATFADNHGIDATWVIQNAIVQLPAQPPLPAGPRPANIPFVFNVPWAYGLTPAVTGLPAPTSLLVEIRIHSQPSGAYRLDNTSSCVAVQSSFGNAGPACAVPGNAPVALTADESMLAGSSYAWHIAHALPSMPFLVTLSGSSSTHMFGNPAWPLPYPMFDPANPSLPSPALAALLWPAPDCWLNVDPGIMAIGGITDAAGAGTASALIPPGRSMVGATFHAQAIVLAPTSNPLRFITSLGRASTVCGPLGLVRIHAFYNGTAVPPALPTTGSVATGVGLIFDVM